MTAIQNLQRACSALYLEAPQSVAGDVQQKANAVIAKVKEMQTTLESLFCCECGSKFTDTKAAEYKECVTHKRVQEVVSN
jgi:hypothetical protein